MSTTRFVTYGDGEETVVGRVEDYTDAESRRDPTEVSRHETDAEAVAEMRRRNRESQQEDRR